MANYGWIDIFKIYNYAFAPDPLSRQNDPKNIPGAGISNKSAVGMLDLRQDGEGGSGNSLVQIGTSGNEMVDTNSVQDRVARYKEYERLRSIAEIENCMTVYADEACVAGSTKVATPFGFPTIEWLAQHKKDERFLVYCFDPTKEDYTLGWAFNPRLTGVKKTVKVVFDDGSQIICTPDHRLLLKDMNWIEAGELKFGTELMPFYKIPPDPKYNKLKTNQFPRIYTLNDGWTNERMFVDKWKLGKDAPYQAEVQKAIRLLTGGLTVRQVQELMGYQWKTIDSWLHKFGFQTKEVQALGKKEHFRRVIGIHPHKEMEVYDLSVEDHKCFATDSIIAHNCQKDDEGHVLKVDVENSEIKEEAEWFFYKLLNVDRNAWNWFKNDIIAGDGFYELKIDPEDPSEGILGVTRLPQETMYRIETVKGRVVEFQQSKDGPDYEALTKTDITTATEADLQQSRAIRFAPEQIVHIRHGEDRQTFYPYGVSLIEAARGPAHQLRMMEDAMLVYRLTRAPERRVFYIDVGTIAGARAEAFIDRMKDQFKKRKTTGRAQGAGASAVEERWHAPSQDEDYWIPIRPNSNTRIDTLPGAQNLGEIDDALYFRNKLYVALNFPKNYFNQEDPNQTRITLSSQDVRFARNIERLQMSHEMGYYEMVTRHLYLRGYPEELYEDLQVSMTPPSDWRELSRAEVDGNRMTKATTLKSAQIWPDYDIYTKVFQMTHEEAMDIQARMKVQKMDDLKLQIIANNPALLGVGLPGADDPGQELGAEAGGPSPDLMPPDPSAGGAPPDPSGGAAPPPALPAPMGMRKYMDADPSGAPPTVPPPADPSMAPPPDPSTMPPDDGSGDTPGQPTMSPPPELPDATEEDIRKYNMGIEDYASEQDLEDIDFSEL
jgi:hypothetical protein